MKKTILILVSVLTLTLTSTLTYAGVVGAFSRVEGRVDILKAGAESAVPVKGDDPVSMGDIVRTKSDGKAEITFKDDTTVRLAPETRMKIDEYVFNPDNSRKTGVLGLFRGKVRAVVSKTKGVIPVGAGASSFNINTPTAVAGVRGTDFFVFHDRGITGVIFKEGSGFVANPNMPDKIVNINAGQVTFVASTNIPPSPPRPATSMELAAHTKDTTPAEKPKEEKKEEKPKEEKAKTVEAKAEDKKEKEKKEENKKEESKKEEKSSTGEKGEAKEDKKGDKKEGETKTAEVKTEETKTEEKKGDEQKPKEGEPAIKEAKTEEGVKEEKPAGEKPLAEIGAAEKPVEEKAAGGEPAAETAKAEGIKSETAEAPAAEAGAPPTEKPVAAEAAPAPAVEAAPAPPPAEITVTGIPEITAPSANVQAKSDMPVVTIPDIKTLQIADIMPAVDVGGMITPAVMMTSPTPIGGDLGLTGAGAVDTVSIPTAITNTVSGTTVDTSSVNTVNLLPVTETHPNLLTDVTINLKFP